MPLIYFNVYKHISYKYFSPFNMIYFIFKFNIKTLNYLIKKYKLLSLILINVGLITYKRGYLEGIFGCEERRENKVNK